MSANKNDLSKLNKYLEGKLDAKAMHQLEREAQDDPFLMEAMEGYEANGKDQQANFAGLQNRLAKRVEPKKERSILLWRVLPIAACLLIALSVGYWFLKQKPDHVKQYASNIKPAMIEKSAPKKIDTQQQAVNKQPTVVIRKWVKMHHNPVELKKPQQIKAESLLAEANEAKPDNKAKIAYKEDTVEYKIAANNAKKPTVDELLKRMEGFEVGADGSVTHQGQTVTKARLNGKDYAGGDVKKAVQNLPADIVEKIQVVDDYGDQASKTGIKSGDPTKVLNITTMDTSKRALLAKNKFQSAGRLKIDTSLFMRKSIQMAAPANDVPANIYSNKRILSYKKLSAFAYSYHYNPDSKIITVTCNKQTAKHKITYVIELRDTKGLFKQNNFSVGDDYQYVDSYFTVDKQKLPLNNLAAVNNSESTLTHISNTWYNAGASEPVIKEYTLGTKNIYLVKGINPFCNGHSCVDYVVYLIQVDKVIASVNSLYFTGTSGTYNFNHTNLFYDDLFPGFPQILVPVIGKPALSPADFDVYKIIAGTLVK